MATVAGVAPELGAGVGSEFLLLGPAEFGPDAGHARQRCVLAVLLLSPNTLVTVDSLMERVWGDDAPPSARNVLYGYITRLRKVLAPTSAQLSRRPGGYVIEVDAESVDVHRFRRLVARARAEGEDARAADMYDEALGLWRGTAFADLSSPWLDTQRDTLEAERLAAHIDRAEVHLRLGRHAALLGELRELASAYPLDERLIGKLMLAAYRCGRQAEALELYARTRRRLADELGVDPGPELAELHQRILRNDAVVAAPTPAAPAPPPRPTPAQLPHDTAGFTGRERELARLHALLDSGGGTVVISAIAGAAGIGKTTLAVHFGHQVADRFPDGQLYVNLRGYDPRQPPLPPGEALGQFLRALGADPAQIPGDLDEQAALYRSLLADKRALIVADNAATAAQVRPLLPGSGGCLVLVTSRQRLPGLVAHEGATPLPLDVLTPEEGRALLVRQLGAGRVTTESRAAAALVELCGRLPLALRVAAADLALHPERSIAAGVAALSGGNRLDALSVDGDEPSPVRAALDLSYRALDDTTRQVFRRAGLVPGPDFTPGVVAAVAGMTDATKPLETLAAAHMVEQHSAGRYRFHDLIRLYAKELAESEDTPEARDEARDRMYGWYLGGAVAAARILYPSFSRVLADEPPDTLEFGGPHEAFGWLETERSNLFAAIPHAAAHGPHRAAWRLPEALFGQLWLRTDRATWLSTVSSGLDAAVRAGDLAGQPFLHYQLGLAYWSLSRFADAIDHHSQGLDLCRRTGRQAVESFCLGGLGLACQDLGRLAESREHHLAALAINQRQGNRDGEALGLAALAFTERQLGELADSYEHNLRALHLHRELGARYGEATTMITLGIVCWELGRFAEAREYLDTAVALSGMVGSRNGQALALDSLARVHRDTGAYGGALDNARKALTITRETGNRKISVDALNTLASICIRMEELDEAATHTREALGIAEAIGYRYGQVEAWLCQAATNRAQGRVGEALTGCERALAAALERGFGLLEGHALTVLAMVHLNLDDQDAALDCARRSLACHRRTQHRLGQARALRLIGYATEDPAPLAAAYEIFAEVDTPEAGELKPLIYL